MKRRIVLSVVVAGVAAAVLVAVFAQVPVSGQAGPAKPGSPAFTESLTSRALPPVPPKSRRRDQADRRRVEALVAASGRAAQGRAQRAAHPARGRRLRLRE